MKDPYTIEWGKDDAWGSPLVSLQNLPLQTVDGAPTPLDESIYFNVVEYLGILKTGDSAVEATSVLEVRFRDGAYEP